MLKRPKISDTKLTWKFYRIYRICVTPIDYLSSLLQRDELMPPIGIQIIGRSTFKKIGEEFRGYFIKLGNLKPEDRVLDIGCGPGRMAIPLTKYLNQNGKYDGFDVFKEGITWCKKNITKRFPNFEFKLADIFNNNYNPNGKVKGSDFVFPYDDNCFDFIFANSVFTHMVPEDLENYVLEISRVLKKGKRCLLTFFLLNPESISLIHKQKSQLKFNTNTENVSFINEKVPEYISGYQESFIRNLFAKHGLNVMEPIKYGYWCGRDDSLSNQQDIIFFTK